MADSKKDEVVVENDRTGEEDDGLQTDGEKDATGVIPPENPKS